MKNYSTETSDSSSSIDSPLVIHTSPPEEQQVTTPTSPLLNENTKGETADFKDPKSHKILKIP